MQKFVVKKQRVDLQNKELINQYKDVKELQTVQEVNEEREDSPINETNKLICQNCDKKSEQEIKSTTKLNTKMCGYLKKKRNVSDFCDCMVMKYIHISDKLQLNIYLNLQ